MMALFLDHNSFKKEFFCKGDKSPTTNILIGLVCLSNRTLGITELQSQFNDIRAVVDGFVFGLFHAGDLVVFGTNINILFTVWRSGIVTLGHNGNAFAILKTYHSENFFTGLKVP